MDNYLVSASAKKPVYRSVKRYIDLMLASVALVGLLPLFAAAAVGIRLSSSGPILFRARRTGLNGTEFTMYKFRSMHYAAGSGTSLITANNDSRVFAFGSWLRRLKIDELPQLINVLRGEMAIVGPRPEDPQIVKIHYAANHLETLTVLPGLASPGSIYNYTHGDAVIFEDDPEKDYVERLLPIKLALEIVYVRQVSLIYDFKIILRTIFVILAILAGRSHFPDPPEMKMAWQLLPPNYNSGH